MKTLCPILLAVIFCSYGLREKPEGLNDDFAAHLYGVSVTSFPLQDSKYTPVEEPLPDFPLKAHLEGGIGEGVVEYSIVDGRVENAVLLSEFYPGLGEAALEAVKKWKYKLSVSGSSSDKIEEKRKVQIKFTSAENESLLKIPRDTYEVRVRLEDTHPRGKNLYLTPIPACRPLPQYPLPLRMEKKSGFVWVQVDLDDSGKVEKIKILQTAGGCAFEESVLRAVSQWTYKNPAIPSGSLSSAAIGLIYNISFITWSGRAQGVHSPTAHGINGIRRKSATAWIESAQGAPDTPSIR